MKILSRIRTLSLALLLLALLAAPLTALAALGITDVRPSQVTNTAPVSLVITGTDFADGAVVVLGGYGALATTFVSATVLTAELPAGVPPGKYNVTVINPDATSTTLNRGLTVNAP